MAKVELKYGTPEEFEREEFIEPSAYEVTYHGTFMRSPLGNLYTAQREDKVYISWGGLEGVDVRRLSGENAREEEGTNFVDMRLEGNDRLVLTAEGFIHQVKARLIEDTEDAGVTAKLIPSRPSYSPRLRQFLDFDNQ
jgi:hypothetical protein